MYVCTQHMCGTYIDIHTCAVCMCITCTAVQFKLCMIPFLVHVEGTTHNYNKLNNVHHLNLLNQLHPPLLLHHYSLAFVDVAFVPTCEELAAVEVELLFPLFALQAFFHSLA